VTGLPGSGAAGKDERTLALAGLVGGSESLPSRVMFDCRFKVRWEVVPRNLFDMVNRRRKAHEWLSRISCPTVGCPGLNSIIVLRVVVLSQRTED